MRLETIVTGYTSRPYAGAEDLPLLIDFARTATLARGPALTYLHPGDVAWQLYLATTPAWFENIHLWFDGAGLAGYALFEPPLVAQFDLRAGIAYGSLFEEMLAWAEARRRAIAGTVETPRATPCSAIGHFRPRSSKATQSARRRSKHGGSNEGDGTRCATGEVSRSR